jgi:microcystin-dependent protein
MCNGDAYSRTDVNAAELFAVIGTNWGAPNATQFQVPDLRGTFLRGVDQGRGYDPDRNSRISYTPGSASGDAAGSFQPSALASHTHTFNGSSTTTSSNGDHNHERDDTLRDGGYYTASGKYGLVRRSLAGENVTASSTDTGGSGGQLDLINYPIGIPTGGAHTHTVTATGSIANTGAAETRPSNMNVYYFIKY